MASEVVLAHAAGCRRIDLYARFNDVLSEEVRDAARALIRRAANHEPVAYLVGEKEFFSLPFTVTPDVLIPRPETEVLVECVLDHLGAVAAPQPIVLDVGTGSGCIAISILVQRRDARAVATDISAAALNVARANAERHQVLDRLRLVEADALELPADAVPRRGFDVVVCNPPYVAMVATATLEKTVHDHEPHIALTDGADGLSLFRKLSDGVPRVLADGGIVVVEMGDGQESAVRSIMERGEHLVRKETRMDRVVGKQRAAVFTKAVSGSIRG